jgi:hypothetical protein
MMTKIPSLSTVLSGGAPMASTFSLMSLRKRMCLIIAVMAVSIVILVSQVDRSQLDASIHASIKTVGGLLPPPAGSPQMHMDVLEEGDPNGQPDAPAQPSEPQQPPEPQQETPFWESFGLWVSGRLVEERLC